MRSALALSTSQELVAELCSRPNFLGLIVYAPEGVRNTMPTPSAFDLVVSEQMREEDARRLLAAGLEEIARTSLGG